MQNFNLSPALVSLCIHFYASIKPLSHINLSFLFFLKEMASVSFTQFEVIATVFHIVTIALLLFIFFKAHTGYCRGAIVSKTQTSDGQCTTRRAKLSMHEKGSELHPLTEST